MSEQIAKRVKDRLQALGKKQQWLADELNVSINAVSKWTRTGQISRQNIPLVAKKLGLPISDLVASHIEPADQGARQPDNLVELGADEHRSAPTSLERVDAEELHLLRCFRECSDEARSILISHATLLAKSAG